MKNLVITQFQLQDLCNMFFDFVSNIEVPEKLGTKIYAYANIIDYEKSKEYYDLYTQGLINNIEYYNNLITIIQDSNK